MSWKELYEKTGNRRRSCKQIKSGDRVVVGHAVGEPSYLLDKMVENKDQYENVEIVHMVAMGKAEYCAPGMENIFVTMQSLLVDQREKLLRKVVVILLQSTSMKYRNFSVQAYP